MRKRYFQWLDGENRGKVVQLKNVYKEDGDTYFEFDDGESCISTFVAQMANSVGELMEKRKNKDNKIIPAFLIEVSSPTNIWGWEEIRSHGVDLGTGRTEVAPPIEDIIGVSSEGTVNSAEGKLKLVPPSENVEILPLPTPEDFMGVSTDRVAYKEQKQEIAVSAPTQVTEQSPSNQPSSVEVKTSPQDPVSILVNSSKKYEKDVEITLSMMLPTKDLFNIVTTNFDDGVDKFIDNIIRDLDVSQIVSAIRNSLYVAYVGHPQEAKEIDMSEENCAKRTVQEDCLIQFDDDGNVIERKLI